MVILILFLLTPTNAELLPEPFEKLEFLYEGTQNCEDFDGDVNMENLSLDQIGKNLVALNGDLVFKKELPDDYFMKVTIRRCPSKAERGLCENMPPKIVNDICHKLQEKGKDWSPFVEKLEDFVPTCPITPGTYHFEEYVVDMDSLASMPGMEAYWIIHSEGYIGENMVMCVNTEGEFRAVKENKKKQ
ncbi:hypothetical protein L9F63_009332 [Diploptera punctata]|uniref:Uncharacterized protein n=1 Tax=Diploptera punctata TaxID=6984 RepID=A0AAD8ALF1_DIPPU|nr:hypothetical protein L9F63_009332 [Diploptera punctata]